MRKTTSVIICIITVVIAIVSWNFLFNSLYGSEVSWFGVWIKPMIVFLILGAILALGSLLIKSKKFLSLIFLSTVFSYFLVFPFNNYVFLSLLILLGLLFLGRARIRDELKVRLKIRIGRILQKGVPLMLGGLIIVIAVSYAFTPAAQKVEVKIPPKLFQVIQKPIEEMLFFEFPKENLKEISIKEVSETVKEIIDAKIEEFSRPYQKYIPLALAVSLLLLLRFVAIPLGWLIILLSWIVFKLLIAFKVVRIEKVEKEAEVIET